MDHESEYDVPVVVYCNRFFTDRKAELDLIIEISPAAGTLDAVVANRWE